MPAKSKFKISTALICDDYRTEKNGKGLVIGLYGNMIGFTETPESFKICACLVGMANEPFGIEIKVEFVSNENELQSKYQIGAQVGSTISDEPFSLFIPVKDITLSLGGDGKLIVKVREKGAKPWKLVSETKVVINPKIPSELQQLS